MNTVTVEVALPCGCRLNHRFTDVDPLSDAGQRTKFIETSARILDKWVADRANKHECPNGLSKV